MNISYDEVTNATLKQKLYDAWGERGTLETTSRRVTLTLKELGILTDATRTRYQLNKMEIVHPKVVTFMIAAAMQIDGNTHGTQHSAKCICGQGCCSSVSCRYNSSNFRSFIFWQLACAILHTSRNVKYL